MTVIHRNRGSGIIKEVVNRKRGGGLFSRLARFCRNAMAVSLEDIVSLVDTVMLLDTIMIGIQVALLTQASISKQDMSDRDAFNFRVTLVENNLFETSIPITSHYILTFGQVGVVLFTLSIGCAMSAYLNLNLSRAREDDEIRERFAKFFLPMILAA